MKISLVKNDFVKGISLVVGKPVGVNFSVDSTVLHTGYLRIVEKY